MTGQLPTRTSIAEHLDITQRQLKDMENSKRAHQVGKTAQAMHNHAVTSKSFWQRLKDQWKVHAEDQRTQFTLAVVRISMQMAMLFTMHFRVTMMQYSQSFFQQMYSLTRLARGDIRQSSSTVLQMYDLMLMQINHIDHHLDRLGQHNSAIRRELDSIKKKLWNSQRLRKLVEADVSLLKTRANTQ